MPHVELFAQDALTPFCRRKSRDSRAGMNRTGPAQLALPSLWACEDAPLAAAAEVTAPDIVPTFFLGVHRPNWLAISNVPLFISHNRLCERRSFPRARAPWALDSGAFTEISRHGYHRTTPAAYARRVALYQREIGALCFASIQDWMCEPDVLRVTGLSVREHQQRTIDNYLRLRDLAPFIPWLPVVQGWSLGEYLDHVEMYERAGVDLRRISRVGVGSICRRQASVKAALILGLLADHGLKLHAFGLKTKGLALALEHVASADSMAWSAHARKLHIDKQKWLPPEQRTKTGEQNSLPFALSWFADTIVPKLGAI